MLSPDERTGTRPSRAKAAESLIRSLVGVADARVGNGNGRIDNIRIVPCGGTSPHQLTRNVASAIMAHFGQAIDPSAITVQARAAETDRNGLDRSTQPASVKSDGHAPNGHSAKNGGTGHSPNGLDSHDPMTRPHDAVGNGHRADAIRHVETPAVVGFHASSPVLASRTETPPASRNGNGHRSDHNGHANGARVRLEAIEFSNVGTGLRCRVAISLAGETFTGVGDGPDRPADITDLAARVTIDALRAARCPSQPMQLEGTATTEVGGQTHIVTAVAVWNGTDFDRVSGAQPVSGSPAEAAALSVIRSVTERLHSNA